MEISDPVDVACALARHIDLQAALGIDQASARIEAQCLLQEVLKVNRAYLFTHSARVLNAKEKAEFDALFERRRLGEPVAYLLGEREFYGLNFRVSPATLIPRHDTELLVETALGRIPKRGDFRVLDMGTGSGAIAIAIAHERPDARVVAVDASEAALKVARGNALLLNAGNVRLLHSDWFDALAGERFDLIVSNPPYIEENDVHLAQGDLRFEPSCALVSGADGLNDIRRIASEAGKHLCVGGYLMFEHGYDQGIRVRQLLQQAGFVDVSTLQDLSGQDRVTVGCA